jgi:hypothetical protein
MLEQAVIDAKALKEAAIKNAEQQVIEKYSQEIREAVDSLLEQEEDPFGVPGEEVDRSNLVDDLPMKALGGEEVCPCPEDDMEVELDLDQLKAAAESEMEMDMPVADQETMFESTEAELLALLTEDEDEVTEEKMPMKPDTEDDLDQDGRTDDKVPAFLNKGDVKKKKKTREVPDQLKPFVNKKKKEESIEEELEFDEESLKQAIEEILKVDLEVEARGDLGTTHPTKAQQKYAVEAAAAAAEDSEKKEEIEKFEKMVADLQEQVNSLQQENKKVVKEYRELKSVALDASKKFEEINTSNAKLIYKNRILESNSLNERQKNRLVESISKANSIDEAKVIFDTLQDSLSSKQDDKAPESLKEALSKNNRLVLKSKQKRQESNSVSDRMKKLAGIM